MIKQLEYHAYDADGVYQGMVIATPDQLADLGFVSGEAPVIDPAIALAQARAAAVAELVAEGERKRLDAIRDTVAVEFKDAKSEKDVSDKLMQLKAARRG